MREFQALYFLVGVGSEARIEKNIEKYWISKIKRNLVLKYNIMNWRIGNSIIGWVSGNIINWGAKPTVFMSGLWPEVNDINHSATQAPSVSYNVYKLSIISIIRCNATINTISSKSQTCRERRQNYNNNEYCEISS